MVLQQPYKQNHFLQGTIDNGDLVISSLTQPLYYIFPQKDFVSQHNVLITGELQFALEHITPVYVGIEEVKMNSFKISYERENVGPTCCIFWF